MSIRVTLQSEGFDAALRKLELLDRAVARPILVRALRKAAEPVLATAKAYAPKDTGQLEGSLRIKSARAKGGGVAVRVTTEAGDYKGDEFYGAFVEYGYRKGSRRLGDKRRVVPPQPYMRPATDEQINNAAEIATQEILKGLENAVK